MASPCGINAALDEAKAGIDSLKEKISSGLNGIGDIGSIADTIKNKLKEVNVPQLPSINLREELTNLPNLTPDEYTAKVAELKKKFGTAVPDLDAIIAKIPKPAGLNAQGNKDIFAQLNDALGNVGAVFQNVQQKLSETSLESVVANICNEKKIDPVTKKEVPVVPNVEVQPKTKTDSNGNVIIITDTTGAPVYDTPKPKPAPPATPKKDPVVEVKPSEPPAGGFTFKFTKDKLIQIGGSKAGEWYDALSVALPKNNITTPERVAAFVANVTIETSWSKFEEDIRYSPEQLFYPLKQGPNGKGLGLNPGGKRFATFEDAQACAAKGPESIANVIYMVARKLFDPQPGDGWKYRGRGLKGLTFKDNYMRCSKSMYGDDRLIKDPDLVAKDKTANLDSAVWFFKTQNMNKYADQKDWGACAAIVNAGNPSVEAQKRTIAYDKRVSLSEKAYNLFKA